MPNFFINVKEKGAKNAAGNIKSLTSSMKMMALQAVSVTAVVQGLKKSIQMSAEMEGVKRGFDNLAKSSGFSTAAFDKFKKATDGTVDSLTLMKQANAAMLLGITDSEDQMANMFDIAQRLGQSLGIDTLSAVESLTVGLGRQSKLVLDNLGITFDAAKANETYAESIGKTAKQLTDQERKQAFVNAAMDRANVLVAQLGEEQLTTKDSIAQVVTAAGDLAIKFGDILGPSIRIVASALTEIIDKTDAFLEWADGMNTVTEAQQQLTDGSDEIAKLVEKYDLVGESTTSLLENFSNIDQQMQELLGTGYIYRQETHALKQELEMVAEAYLFLAANAANIIVSTPILTDATQEYLNTLKKIPEQIFSASDAQEQAIATEAKLKKDRKEAAKEFGSNIQTMAKAYPEMEKAGKRAAQVQALVDAYASANAAFKAMAGIPVVGPALGATAAIAALGAGLANVKMIEKAATGMDQIVTQPTMILAGEAGPEHIGITPLNAGMNQEGPQGGGQSINVSIQGNVMTDQFVEEELAEKIKEAIRRGTDFGIS